MIAYRSTRTAVALATVLVLAACAVPYNDTTGSVDGAYPHTAQTPATTTDPASYRGSQAGVSAVTSDAAINANVLATLARLPGQEGTNIQVSTNNGVVTLRGVADTSLAAQNNVQAARQVSGVQRVDYDIQVRRR